MFEKIGRLAETAANSVSVSRRGFLGWLGQAALGAAGVVGGLLVLPAAAEAHGSVVCCKYDAIPTSGCLTRTIAVCLPAGSTCGPTYSYDTCQGTLKSQQNVADCSKCK